MKKSRNAGSDPERFDQENKRWEELKPAPTAVLLDLLCEDDEITRRASAMELQMRGEQVAYDRAVELYRSTHDHLREISAFLLGQLGTPKFPLRKQTIPLLEQILTTDPSPRVREAAAMGLGHHRATSAVQSLLKTVNDPDAGVRGGVAIALGLLGLPEVAPALGTLSKDADVEVRDSAECGFELLEAAEAEKK